MFATSRLDSSSPESINGDLFQYTPLANKDEIRLLHLQPGALRDPLQCTISHEWLPDCICVFEHLLTRCTACLACKSAGNIPSYEAISYTWGSQTLVDEILCDNFQLPITANCAQVLRRVRDPHRPRVLWIDAICIDQTNIQERSNQVRFMHRIYRGASNVIICLGEASPDSDTAITILEEEGLQSKRRFFTDTLSSNEIEALQNLFRRSWFKRVWILQEVAWAWSAQVICGSRITPWDGSFRGNAYSWIAYHDSLRPFPYVMGFGPSVRDMARTDLGHFTPKKFFDQLCLARDCNATDPRDKIFALLPLFTALTQDPRLCVNYARSPTNVFTNVASYFLSTLGPSFLSQVFRGSPGSMSGLPTWVPDWTVPSILKPSELTGYSAGGPDFDAVALPRISHDITEDVLRVYAVHVDVISSVGLYNESWKLSVRSWMDVFLTELGGTDLPSMKERRKETSCRILHNGLRTHLSPPVSSSGNGGGWAPVTEKYKEVGGEDWEGQMLFLEFFGTVFGTLPIRAWARRFVSMEMLVQIVWETLMVHCEEGPKDSARIVDLVLQLPSATTKRALWRLGQIESSDVYNQSQLASIDALYAQEIVRSYNLVWAEMGKLARKSSHRCLRRKYFVSRNDRLSGLATIDAQIGDEIFVIRGGPLCYILRPMDGYYTFVGDCYVQGYMDGQADSASTRWETIEVR
ncbi:HET-domain-containing protein [Lepidopterella palustris CBS 459.81]|uniref:HET-domain-containing protein n=1 Tax=Lepidopterella palustris CBS 459.81 TaxID=1314670 RepID=A0A8E2E0D6_9PEZI|nr:HET-domain-containing protein [Lepidopterella palustris CBS 459.81]